MIRLLLENLRHRRAEYRARRLEPVDIVTQLRNLQRGGTVPTGSNVLCGCGRLMGVEKNDTPVEEVHEDGTPYKLWFADRYVCPECGAVTITGFGRAPFAEHWHSDYTAKRAIVELRDGPIYKARCRPAGFQLHPAPDPRD